MDRQEIMTFLPHRDSMLLLDNLTMEGDTSHGDYHFCGDEWFFNGHFPDQPVVPGLILCEILAQSASILIRQYATPATLPFLVGLDRTRFHQMVHPGDTYVTECQLVKFKKPFYFFKGTGCVGKKRCLQMEFAIALLDPPQEESDQK